MDSGLTALVFIHQEAERAAEEGWFGDGQGCGLPGNNGGRVCGEGAAIFDNSAQPLQN